MFVSLETETAGTRSLRPDFQALRRGLADPHSAKLLYYAFDLLYLNGRDLPPASLLERKEALKAVLPERPSTITYVDH
jgi:bifunctional non-homologous end joining protein LigD